MKLSPAMIELFLRSAGAPRETVELFKLIQAQGFGAFGFKPMDPNDPNWATVATEANSSRRGLWMRARCGAGVVTVAIFLEGVNDEVFAKFAAMAGVSPAAALPSGS